MQVAHVGQVVVPLDKIVTLCETWGIVEFALFGSVLRADFNQNSDIDVLVRFAQGTHISLSDFVRLGDELEALFGRKVDVITRSSVEESPNYIRRRSILDSAQVIYAR